MKFSNQSPNCLGKMGILCDPLKRAKEYLIKIYIYYYIYHTHDEVCIFQVQKRYNLLKCFKMCTQNSDKTVPHLKQLQSVDYVCTQ